MSYFSILFWMSVLLLMYTFLGYPIVMRFLAAFGRHPHRAGNNEPKISLVIVAHNEASRVAQRLDNVLSLDYPRDRLEIIFGSDGSTDGTAERAWAYAQYGVKVLSFGSRRGKPAVLNDILPKTTGEIVVLADARQQFKEDALHALVRHFGDPQVGAVSGELILAENPEGGPTAEGVGLYWRYEKFIRRNESRFDSTVGATGAIYAVRRALFEPLPEDTLLDDVWIPMRIVRKGYRVLFEPLAKAYDRVAATGREEFKRKVRTLAGNFQLFMRERWVLNPFRNRLWFQTVSHKGLRLLIPIWMVVAFGSNLFLLDHPFYRWTLLAQILFYAAAVGGKKIPLLSVPYVVCLLSWATVMAFLRFISGRQTVAWDRESAVQPPHRPLDSVGLSAKTSHVSSGG